MTDVKYPEIEVQLSGEDGNAFAIMGRISQAIRRQVGNSEAEEYVREAQESESYDALLRHAMRTVTVL